MSYIKYACSQYFTWLGYIATVIGLVAVVPFDEKYNYIALVIVIACFASIYYSHGKVQIQANNSWEVRDFV